MTTSLADFQAAADAAKIKLDSNNAELSALAQKVSAIDPQAPDAQSQLQELERQKGETLKSIKARSVTIFRELNALNKDVPPADLAAAIDIYEGVLSYNKTSLKINYDQCDLALEEKTAQLNAPAPKQDPVVESPTQPSSTTDIAASLPPADSVTGLGTGNYTDKLTEGLLSAESKFGSKLPFDKPTCLASDFKELANPVAIAQSQGKSFADPVLDNIIANQVAPQAPQASASSVNAVEPTNPGDDETHLVTLEDNEGNIVKFLVMPEIIENRSVSYEPVAPPQFPGAFQKYKGTESVQWNINATFISRTTPEATKNLINLNILRGWTMPYFGQKIIDSAASQFDPAIKSKLGAPPPVLIFKGFRSAIVGPVPVVITSLNWNWPRDVDYIPATAPDGSAFNIPFPTVISLAINVVESFSTEQFNNFDLSQYKLGNFEAAFGGGSAVAKNTASEQQKDFSDTKGEGYVGNEDTIAQYAKLSASVTTPPAQVIEGVGNFAKDNKILKEVTPMGICERKSFENPYVAASVSTIKSGLGGDFGGGGASGNW